MKSQLATFNYIRNQIRLYKKEDIIDKCYYHLSKNEDEIHAVWFFFTILKWTFLYGGEQYPLKELTIQRFNIIYKALYSLDESISMSFLKSGQIDKAFLVMSSQQFYLQKRVFKETFAMQLKLFIGLNNNGKINSSFEEKTGLTIQDVIFFFQTIWIIVNSKLVKDTQIKYYGYLSEEHIEALTYFKGKTKVHKFLELLTIDHVLATEKIKNSKYQIKQAELQSHERTFFTMFPFHWYKSKINIIHKSILNYTFNHFIYDFLKATDETFTEEFGKRFERYIECGIKETGYKYKTEKQLKLLLPEKSKLVDFLIEQEDVFIECKAIELPALPSVNPTDELLYSSLRDSVIKAYTKQMLEVLNNLKIANKEYFGIIITYKELFWSGFAELYELGKKDISENIDTSLLPPENVFIIDVNTWDYIVQIVKNGEATLREILVKVKSVNSDLSTRKQLVYMHLSEYKTNVLDLSYLREELELLNSYNYSGI